MFSRAIAVGAALLLAHTPAALPAYGQHESPIAESPPPTYVTAYDGTYADPFAFDVAGATGDANSKFQPIAGRRERHGFATHPDQLSMDVDRRLQAPIYDGGADTSGYWTWEVLPDGLLYKSYLAGPKEPRISGSWLYSDDTGWLLDATLGGRVGIVRFGTPGTVRAEGWQLDIEGAGFPRLNLDEGSDLDSADFRFGVPLTWSRGPYEVKFGYYHISAHVGDEFLERNPGFERVNYVRDAFVLGSGYHVTTDVRVYAEVAYSFRTDGGAEPWELQFGAEYSPAISTGFRGAPFAAVNGHLFEEHDFGGNLNVMAGWQWRGTRSDRLLRAGLQYFNGKSSQFAFFDEHEQLVGAGLWFDY